jgi:hypothetical protein
VTLGAEPELEIPRYLSQPLTVYWNLLHALTFATTWTIHYQNTGWTAQLWDTSSTDAAFYAYRDTVRNYYIGMTPAAGATQLPTKWGEMLAALWSHVADAALQKTDSISFFDRYSPPRGFRATLLNPAGNLLDQHCPAIIPDIWIQFMSHFVPKWQSTFPLPMGSDSVTGMVDDSMAPVNVGSNLVGGGFVDKDLMRLTLNDREIPHMSDEARWNERWLYANGAIPCDLNGNQIINTIPAGFIARQRHKTPQIYAPVWAPPVYHRNTCLYATNNMTNLMFFAILANAALTQQRRILVGVAQGQVSGWVLGQALVGVPLISGTTGPYRSYWDQYARQQPKEEMQVKPDPSMTTGTDLAT